MTDPACCRRDRAGRLLVDLRVTPGASRDAVGGIWTGPGGETRLVVRVIASADKGKANAATLALLSATLSTPKSSLSILSGDKDRLKTVLIGPADAALVTRLAALVAEGTTD